MLYTKALEVDIENYNRMDRMRSFTELDVSTRALVEAMVWQTSRWGDFYECFATCTWYVPTVPCTNDKRLDSFVG